MIVENKDFQSGKYMKLVVCVDFMNILMEIPWLFSLNLEGVFSSG